MSQLLLAILTLSGLLPNAKVLTVGADQGSQKLWIPSKLIKIRFDRGRPPENHGCRHEGRNQEKLQDRWEMRKDETLEEEEKTMLEHLKQICSTQDSSSLDSTDEP